MTALSWIRRYALAAAVSAFALPNVAAAEMLDEPACNALKNEQQRLAAEGLKTDMLRGPEWAKANLPAARFEQIKHLMDVEEQIAFRCPLPPPPKVQQAEPAGAAPGDGSPAVVKKKKAKKKTDDAAVPASDAAITDDKPAEAPKKKKKAVKKKEDVNDAYVPPSATGNAFVDGGAGEPVPQPPPSGPASKQLAP